jgi:short-subunit dehydrogenase
VSESRQSALITGASSGIGRATAIKLAERGFYVIVAARRAKRLKDLADQFQNITPKQVDFSQMDETKAFCQYLSQLASPVTVLVNNAGYGVRGTLEDLSIDVIRRIFEVNLFALMRITQACLPGMRKRKKGTIVNLSSMVGKFILPCYGVYAATKYAVEGITDALRLELAPFGIKVIAIRPGPIATEFNKVVNRLSGDLVSKTDPDYRPIYQTAKSATGRILQGLSIPGPDLIADIILEAILSDTPEAVYSAGPLSHEFLGKRKNLDDKDFHDFLLERFELKDLQV